MKRILITGSAGFLGKNLYKRLKSEYRVIGADIKKSKFTDYLIDLANAKKTKGFIKNMKPHIIIHTAALSNVEYCQTHRDEVYKNNVEATKNLIDCPHEQKVKFIFISSDYVYDGIEGNFNEESPVNPLNYYGQTKLEAEKIVKRHENHLILRPTVMFGWDEGGKNFFMQLFRNQKEQRPMRVPIDQYSNPTHIDLLVEIIYRGILRDLTGLFVATGPETLNRYDFALKICDVFGFNNQFIIPLKTEELGQIARRPLNCGTNNSKIRKALQMDFPSLRESLIDLKSSCSFFSH